MRLLPTLDFPETETGTFLARAYATQEEGFLAVEQDESGDIVDLAYSWETAESLALNGSRVTVLWSDGDYWDVERVQRLCDTSRAAYLDCFAIA